MGAALLAAGAMHSAGVGTAVQWLAGGAAAAAVVVLAVRWNRARPAGPVEVARHLDRTVPSLEESTDLVLDERSDAPLVTRLERTRVERALAAIAPVELPPDRASRSAIIAGAVAVLAGSALLLFPPATAAASRQTHPAPPTRGAMIGGTQIRIEPPAYTRAAPRTQTAWDIEAPEGSLVAWRIAADADSAWITTSSGDTVPLRANGSRERTASLRVGASLLYQVIARRGPARRTSELYRLAVTPDAPPLVQIASPRGRTQLRSGDRLTIPVEVHAGDDWGVGPARLVATLTSGVGEAVKFREQILPLSRGGSRADLPHGLTLGATLDLAALGLSPGDELYFYAEAADLRQPTPNLTRSETVFLSLADTGRPETATIAGIAVSLAPEFFRSQRQIIMDTEKLIADRPRITLETFRTRSNDIGLDQSLLRGRYGQYVGDETETGEDPVAGHQHDTPENATLLAESVKSRLKAALAQMWEAELRLRTYRPADALPFEYRALEHLKEAQQSARVYVQRVGFEPPPLDPPRTRLTGKLDGIASRTDRDSASIAAPFPAARAAAAALSGAAAGRPLPPETLAALERAVSELAPRAAADSGVFATIRTTRALVDSARAGVACRGCADRALRGLLRAVPAAEPLPAPARETGDALARRYYQLLEPGR